MVPHPRSSASPRGSVRRIHLYLIAGACCVAVAAGLAFVHFRRPPVEPRIEPELPLPAPPPEAEIPKKVLTSSLAGRWYDADAGRLRAELQGYLDNAEGESLGPICALVLPHAGYRWSGQTAAYGIKQIAGARYARVVVLGPTHNVRMVNRASLPDATHYETPFGEVPLDVAFMEALEQYPEFMSFPEAHSREHSVQIEVPLLQMALDEFRLVPIVVGQLDLETARTMGRILLGLIDPGTLVVVSSDFTHYGPRFEYVPFRDNVQEQLEALDRASFEAICAKDPEALFRHVADTGTTVCGRCPIAVLLSMLSQQPGSPPDTAAHLLHYDTSGALTGDFTESVSYLSIAFTGTWTKGERVAMDSSDVSSGAALAKEDKERLLKLARATVAYYLEHQRVPTPQQLGIEITPGMERTMGAFVTLHKGGRLRGCIGEIIPRRPVYEAVMAQALNAAFNDTRFPPVEAEEEPELEFEISAYADAPTPVPSYEDIVLGRHGIVLEKSARTALFLPQVAPEQGWGIE
ncbi:MAG: AmmeMemoRadiSam system protein B, partial [Candidatus Hydrogenedentes bacterium]|nr:AmmeMemoRadiSam system protein B [Candidatus Hydrogenedentota bacterium]